MDLLNLPIDVRRVENRNYIVFPPLLGLYRRRPVQKSMIAPDARYAVELPS